MFEIQHYVSRSGKDLFSDWFERLHDNKAKARIAARIDRLAVGNFGDCRSLRAGVWELRIDTGPGYRVYYARVRETCLLLLCGGDKRKQDSDIDRAVEYFKDYRDRVENEEA